MKKIICWLGIHKPKYLYGFEMVDINGKTIKNKCLRCRKEIPWTWEQKDSMWKLIKATKGWEDQNI